MLNAAGTFAIIFGARLTVISTPEFVMTEYDHRTAESDISAHRAPPAPSRPSPFLSIVTACLNNRQGLSETHRSLEEQELRDFEWIVMDGGSTDGTVEFLREIEGEGVVWLSQVEDGTGPVEAMNKGLDRCNGRYVLVLPSGDVIAGPEVFRKLAEAAADHGEPDMIYGDLLEQTSSGSMVYKKARSHRFIWYGLFAGSATILHKRSCIGLSRYSSLYPIADDYAFTIECLKRARAIVRLNFPVTIYAQAGRSFTHADVGRKDFVRIRRDLLRIPAPVNYFIYAVQTATFFLRTRFPSLYWLLRLRKL